MKKSQILFVTFSFFLISFCNAQYVALKDKKFIDENGDDYYPLLVNYSAVITSADGGLTWGIAPTGSYGVDVTYECGSNLAGCSTAMLRDLQQIADMGFNGIRLFMASTKEYDQHSPYHSIPGFKINETGFPTYPNIPVHLDLSSPYMTDPNTQLFFAKIDEILGLCEQVVSPVTSKPLKVKLLCGVGNLTANDDAVNDYAEYLTAMGYYFTHISTHSGTIMAYDLYNEPGWNDHTDHTKQDICDIVSKWCGAIRVYDSHHLITMGLEGYIDALEWDPAIMCLDFASEHIYPSFPEYENYDYNLMKERFHNEITWLKNNCPIPWMIGESSFAASDDVDININFPPYVMGPESDPVNHYGQDDFMEFLLNEIRDAGGAGCSWWNFGDLHWASPLDGEGYWQNSFGLIRFGDYTLGYSGFTKPCVNKVLAFDHTNIQTFIPTTNGSYNNPLNYPPNSNAITGHVQDQNGNPISDAYVLGWTVLDWDYSDPAYIGDISRAAKGPGFVITDINGDFELRPYDYHISVAHPTPERNVVEAINISAYDCDRYFAIWGPSTANTNIDTYDPFQPSSFHSPVVLKRNDFQYDGTVDNVTVINGNYKKFRGYNSLTASNVTVNSGGVADFTSHSEIITTPMFEAKRGSETHIYISASDCDDTYFNTFNRMSNPNSNNLNNENKIIEVNFRKNTPAIEIYPNPNTGKFTVIVNDGKFKITDFEIVDINGRTVWKAPLTSNSFDVDMSLLSKGIYLLRAKVSNYSTVQKIIIN